MLNGTVWNAIFADQSTRLTIYRLTDSGTQAVVSSLQDELQEQDRESKSNCKMDVGFQRDGESWSCDAKMLYGTPIKAPSIVRRYVIGDLSLQLSPCGCEFSLRFDG